MRPASASKPPPLGPGAGPSSAAGPQFTPVVPFPSPSAKARIGPRPPTDPMERASTEAFDATGVHEQPSEFESSTSEGQPLDARAFTDAEEIGDTHAADRANPTEQDLPLVKPPPGQTAADFDDDGAAASVASAPAGSAGAGAAATSAAGAAKPDRLARGLRAFGFKPAARADAAADDAARADAGAFELGRDAGRPGPSERPETSPLIPPPAPARPRTAAAPAAPPAVAASPATTPAVAASPTAPPAVAAPPAAAEGGTSVKVPISTAPSSLPPPSEKQSATSGPSPACPQCEAPMAWVEEHLRFYCKSCKMYF
ncbi:MAG TPA: hypothetical protein VK932_05295 [Kofleriaceae bacterium]|nr:hypothetical protein [Kofleriaceae bacterium]